MFLSVALLPRSLRRQPGNLMNVALLPKFLKRYHPKVSDTRSASLKRWLTWASMKVVLQELIECGGESNPMPEYWCVRVFLRIRRSTPPPHLFPLVRRVT